MRDLAILFVHLLTMIARLIRLIGPGGARAVVAESLLLKQQLIVANRSRQRAPNLRPTPGSDGPSWLALLGHMKDSLWSIDFFRCESATLRSHWVPIVMDHWSRRIVGFAVHAGDVDGIALLPMAITLQRDISGADGCVTGNSPRTG